MRFGFASSGQNQLAKAKFKREDIKHLYRKAPMTIFRMQKCGLDLFSPRNIVRNAEISNTIRVEPINTPSVDETSEARLYEVSPQNGALLFFRGLKLC